MTGEPRPRAQDGFSIIEMIIALFLLAVLALAVLPLVIGATRLSQVNSLLVSATAFGDAQLALVRAGHPNDPSAQRSCAALHSDYARTGIVDPAETEIHADVAIASCPVALEEYPHAVQVTVRVYAAADPTTTLVSLPTKVLVSEP